MNQRHYFLGVVAAGLCCTGCVPLRPVTSPGASGTVMDARTHAPVGGAQVVVCRVDWNERKPRTVEERLTNARPPRVITKANGKFLIRDEHQLVMYFPVEKLLPSLGELVITREGYEPARLRLIADPGWAGGVDTFLTGEITNLASFATKLKVAQDPVSAWLMERFSAEGRAAVANYPASGMDSGLLQSILVKELNTVVGGAVIYETNRFRAVKLSSDALGFIEHERRLTTMIGNMDEATYRETYRGASTPAFVRATLNRRLLVEAYPGELSRKQGSGYYYEHVGVVLLTPVRKGGGLAEGK